MNRLRHDLPLLGFAISERPVESLLLHDNLGPRARYARPPFALVERGEVDRRHAIGLTGKIDVRRGTHCVGKASRLAGLETPRQIARGDDLEVEAAAAGGRQAPRSESGRGW